MLGHKRLSRFKLPRPLTPWDTGAYDPYTVIPISLCSAGIHSLIGINSNTRLANQFLLEVCRILSYKAGIHDPREHGCTSRGSLPWLPPSHYPKDCRLIPPHGNRRLLAFKNWSS